MVEVDYDAIERLLQARNLSRRQLAKVIGVSPDTLAGSFRRKSKMKLYQLWQISKALNVRMYDLLGVNADENYAREELEKLESEQIKFEYIANDEKIEEITRLLERLNSKGLNIIKSIVIKLTEVSELQAQYKVQHFLFPEHEYSMSQEELESFMKDDPLKEKED